MLHTWKVSNHYFIRTIFYLPFIYKMFHTKWNCKQSEQAMGPKIFSYESKKSGIKYSVRALPIGGFVSMAGEDEASEDPNAFCNKNVWRRISTVLAGPITNIIVGFLGMFILVALTGPATNIVASFMDDATSVNYGL